MPAQLCLHIAGGCLLQASAPQESLFYQHIQEQLMAQYNVQSEVQLYSYSRFAALPNIVASIAITATQKHLLIIQIRPSLLFQACSMFSNIQDGSSTYSNRCDSSHTGIQALWNQWLGTANCIAGTIAGQHNSAITRINTHITHCVHWCLQHNVLPVILGPVHSYLTSVHRLYVNSINSTLHKAVDSTGGIYIDAYDLLQTKAHKQNDFFTASGLQLTAAGHRELANHLLSVAGTAIARHSKQSSFSFNHSLANTHNS